MNLKPNAIYCNTVQQIAHRMAQHFEIISKITQRARILPMGFTISTT